MCGLVLAFSACSPEPNSGIEALIVKNKQPFPEVDYPHDNAPSQERITLGKALFHDVALSKDSSVSCASCHKAKHAFSDDEALSIGAFGRKGRRNTPPLFNLAYHPYFTREGGVPSLEMQVLVPIQEHDELAFNIIELQKRLENDATYQQMSKEAYARELDYYVITRALANYERSLVSNNSAYDQWLAYQDPQVLSKQQKEGMQLFFSKRTQCSSCHGGFNFTDYRFANNGLYAQYADQGRMRLTGKIEDQALFKTPSLRNVQLTSPYMHDGSLPTLEDVVAHYNAGGKPHPNKSALVKPLNLSDTEQAAIVAFLKSLTDEHFIETHSIE